MMVVLRQPPPSFAAPAPARMVRKKLFTFAPGFGSRRALTAAADTRCWKARASRLAPAGCAVYLGAMRRFPIVIVLAALGCAGGRPGDVAPQERARGHLFIVGGGARPEALMRRFVELAGGEDAHIAVVPLASGSPDETGEALVAELSALGARARVLLPTRADAERADAAVLLGDATGVWFSGGSQSRVTAVLAGTPLSAAIGELYRAGGVVGGTSAGAAIMSDPMITGSQVRDTLGYFGDEFRSIARDYIQLAPGLGYARSVIIDQHFTARERHNRLLSAVLSHPYRLGAGIDESTALVIRPDGVWEIVGASVVSVYDARDARLTDPGAPLLGAAAVRLHVLPAGGTFDPATGVVTLRAAPSGVGR